MCVFVFYIVVFKWDNIKVSIVISQLYILITNKKVQCTIIRRIPIVFFDKNIIITIPIIIYFLLYGFTYCSVCYFVTSLVILSQQNVLCYLKQGKAMFSEGFVCPQWGRGLGRLPPLDRPRRIGQTQSRQTPSRQTSQEPPVLTSCGGHCSGRYASYWNAYLFGIVLGNSLLQ